MAQTAHTDSKSIEEENRLEVSDHSILNVSPLGLDTANTQPAKLLHGFAFTCEETMCTPGSCCLSHSRLW